MHVGLDTSNKKLLNIIQSEFPLTSDPFTALAQILDIKKSEVITRIAKLKSDGIIRLIGPVLDTRHIGYQTTLVAMKIRPEILDNASKIIVSHPLVSHCYERNHDFNFWFTLAMPIEVDIEKEIKKLSTAIKADETLNLPAIKVFKIRTYFDLGKNYTKIPNPIAGSADIATNNSSLSLTDRFILNELQQDLPLTPRPFNILSSNLSMDVDEFLNHCQALVLRKVIRRYSASISHTRLGFVANAMSCWKVPSNMVETVGNKMASFQEISHCYERKVNSAWPYNIFAMMHAKDKETCQLLAQRMCSETGLEQGNFILLFSTKEFKKARVRYQL